MEKKKIIIILVCILAVLVGMFAVSAAVKNDGKNEGDKSLSAESSQSQQSESTALDSSVSGSDKNEAKGADENEKTQGGGEVNTSQNSNKNGLSGSKAQGAQNSDNKNNNSPEKTTQKKPERTTAKETQKQNITVSISITCKNAVSYVNSHEDCKADVPQSGYFLKSTGFTVKNGSTVFDVLKKACSENSISLSYSSPSYITGIGGLYEKDCGGGSGWMYRVNGNAPTKGANKYVLKDGDTIEWYYVTSPSGN